MSDSAAMAVQSDPLKNPHFRRRWSGPPLDRSGPRVVATTTRGTISKDTSSGAINTFSARLLQAAFRLDRLADAELAVGHADHAERLSHAAAELREASR